MDDVPSSDQSLSLSKRLYHVAGWRQGSLFSLPGVQVLTNCRSPTEESDVTILSAPCAEGELLILVSQDCDTVSDQEATIEAMVCRTMSDVDRGRMRSLIRDSAREYVLDWERGLVADARRRILLEKKLLELATQTEWSMRPETRREFVGWLAWRFNRPPVDDDLVTEIQRPLKEAIQRLERKATNELAVFVNLVKEVRIRYPQGNDTEIVLFFVLNDIEPSKEELDAFDLIVEELKRAIARIGRFTLTCEAEEYSTVLLRAYDATQPLRFDYLTRWGDELVDPTGVLRELRRG